MGARIVVEFQKGFFSDEEISELKRNIDPICPMAFQQTDIRILAAFDDIISALTIYITPDFWTQLYAGLAVSGICSGIAFAVTQMKNVIQKKKGYRVTADEVQEKISPIKISANNINILLPADISDEKFQFCINKAFESVRDSEQIISEKETITFFDKKHDDMVTYSVEEYYWKIVYPRRHNQSET